MSQGLKKVPGKGRLVTSLGCVWKRREVQWVWGEGGLGVVVQYLCFLWGVGWTKVFLSASRSSLLRRDSFLGRVGGKGDNF